MKFIITYFPEFRKLALREALQIDPDMQERRLAENISVVDSCLEPFHAQILASDPVFIRHLFPVLAQGRITGRQDEDCAGILETVKATNRLEAGASFSVQCRIVSGGLPYSSKTVEVFVGTYLESLGAVPKFSDTEIQNEDVFVVSVLICGGVFYTGFSRASENLNSHCDEYRILSHHSQYKISRAENKLKEAINKFHIQLQGSGYALDLGAAPGGWTKVLADYGYHVVAVDPGMLHESLRENKNIEHFQCRIENLPLDRKFEMIVNDMNIDPQETSRMMNGLAGHLADGGTAVVTLKLPFSDVERSLRESVAILKQQYTVGTMKNLSHNRREVTVLLTKRAAK